MHWFVSRFHARMVLSALPEYNMLLCTIRQHTALVCPCNVAIWVPDGSVRRSLKCSLKNPAGNSTPLPWRSLRFKQVMSVYLVSTKSESSLLLTTSLSIMVMAMVLCSCLKEVWFVFDYLFYFISLLFWLVLTYRGRCAAYPYETERQSVSNVF